MVDKKIEDEAKGLVYSFSNGKLPIDVFDIAKKIGIAVKSKSLESNISGLLVLENDKPTIGFNSNHPEVRRRFTVAHEIGHYILHRDEIKLFIEKTYPNKKTEKYSVAVYRKDVKNNPNIETEANAFAAALLMPASLVIKEFNKLDFDLSDDENEALIKMAKKFRVSLQAISYRLANLDLL